MSGLLALLDDVAAIAKVAAASVDDVIGQAAKAGAKAAGAVIDDAAVTPKYVQGFEAKRELPIVWRIAKGSLKNKLLILLPAGLALSAFAPWVISPLLMLGGAYLCFEGAEKIAHKLFPGSHADEQYQTGDPTHLEEAKVAGAIKTDFILSAEIMTIALAAIPVGSFVMEAMTLAVVGIGITILVYGGVALIVKADDVGLHMSLQGRLGLTRALGRAIVKGMPKFLTALSTVGTAAMLWVGGQIIVHGFGIHPAEFVGLHEGALAWIVDAALCGVFGLMLGAAIVWVHHMIWPAKAH